MPTKRELLTDTVEHIDIKRHNCVPVVEAMQKMAFSARDLARAADIYDRMLRDHDCGIILCLAGSLVSAGLKQIFIDMVRNRMVDAIDVMGDPDTVAATMRAYVDAGVEVPVLMPLPWGNDRRASADLTIRAALGKA